MLKTVGNFDALSEAAMLKAKKEAEEIVERARKVSERDLEAAREQSERIQSARIAQTKARLELEQKQILFRIQLETRQEQMSRKEQWVSAVFREALSRLSAMPRDAAYRDLLKASILTGLSVLKTDGVRIVLSGKDQPLFDRAFREALSAGTDHPVTVILSKETHEGSGGAIVQSEDGRVAYDSTFEGRLARMKEDLRTEVARMIF
ncbi:MAG: V-type ATP synthase subunit E family protein [Candidatus Latescibacterota bacterium]